MPPQRNGSPPHSGRLGAFEREAYFVNFLRLRIGVGVVLAASLLLLYLIDVRNAIGLAAELRSFSLVTHLFSCGLAGLVLLAAARIAPASPAQVGTRHRTFVRAASVAGFAIAGLTFVLSLLHQGVTTTYVFAVMFYALLLSDPGRFDLALYAGNALFFQGSLLWLRPEAPFDVDGLVATVGAYVISRQTLRWRRREFQARRTVEEQARGIEVANRELARAKTAAEDASRVKGEFLARMSHEVRTPMNGVLGVSGLLLETELSERQRRYATAIRSSGEALVRVLDDVLDLAKLEAGRLALASASFDVRQVAGDAVALFGETCRSRGVELRLEVDAAVPAWVRGDAGRVRQVLLNLVANAARFTRAGEIAVEVGTAASQGEALLRFEVRDTGPGIPESEAATLFEPFVQAGGGAGGTGLGLAICRELVELMGGRIGCESAPGRGSCFWFTVRAAPGEPPAAGETPAREAAASAGRYRGRVLLAEDDPVSRMVVTELL